MSANAAPTIRVSGLTKRFGAVHAVRGIDFEVSAGEIFGLVGPDGAGKTTTMRMLAGVLRPDAGTLSIDGIDVARDPEKAKLHLSYMPQRFGLYEDLTVGENVFFYSELFAVPRRERVARSAELLHAAGLEGFERRLAGQLSGGMKQKLGLVCALIHTPRVLLLDEPTTGVDAATEEAMRVVVRAVVARGTPVLMTTHDLERVDEWFDRLMVLDRRMLAIGTPAEVAASGAYSAIREHTHTHGHLRVDHDPHEGHEAHPEVRI